MEDSGPTRINIGSNYRITDRVKTSNYYAVITRSGDGLSEGEAQVTRNQDAPKGEVWNVFSDSRVNPMAVETN